MSSTNKNKLGPRATRPVKSVQDTFRPAEATPAVKTSLTLNADLYKQLKVYAAANSLPLNKLVDEAIGDLLKKRQ
ncbi:ribbon-helix-helix domain-containing protein [Corynebacterium suicordis]|uniref:Ribbon-helix-helix domain-containing protein n=1 Tax=Corynebacterium suicordis DSM 45110 TaxID=1121369 RepID=A0ABR9ZLV0_9CORY|nr:ribbon-helix-helix domain-containing protein [Corynebacterium suicordis]MBF4554362.1 ribbon-helix-helix domain-containing protein [Corynebacterium suicordis DSM 45110]MDR6278615.1 putative DNA-binding ribbon-helix-helix protein [Corynebacterium suicordis]